MLCFLPHELVQNNKNDNNNNLKIERCFLYLMCHCPPKNNISKKIPINWIQDKSNLCNAKQFGSAKSTHDTVRQTPYYSNSG